VLEGKTAVQRKHQEATIAVMRQKGCDAVIIGNGG
jgi:hypothetical protein